jgi:hypothetical protein
MAASYPEATMRPSLPGPATYPSEQRHDVRFVPAGWLVAALGVARLVVSKGKYGKLGIAALVWAVTPRKLKLFAAGFVAAALIVVMGALAAIVLLAMQLA